MDNTCVICLENISPETCYTLPCNHVLHEECFANYFQYNYDQEQNLISCPICKTEFSGPLDIQRIKTIKKCILFFIYMSFMSFFTYRFVYFATH